MTSWVRRRAATLVVIMIAMEKIMKVQTTTIVRSQSRRKKSKCLIIAYFMCDINGMMPSYMSVSLSHIRLFSFSFKACSAVPQISNSKINTIIPLFPAVRLWILHCSMKLCRLSIRTLCPCIFISLASLACTFTTLHMIQYSMRDHNNNNNNNTSTGPQNHDLIDLSASASNYDTPNTTSISKNTKKTNSWWTENKINLLLDYIEANCILTTAWGTNMKKSRLGPL